MRARTITDGMAIAAAHELARCAEERGISEESILPTMEEWEVVPRIAVATAMKAQEEGVARLLRTREDLHNSAVRRIREVREAMKVLLAGGVIVAPPPPPEA